MFFAIRKKHLQLVAAVIMVAMMVLISTQTGRRRIANVVPLLYMEMLSGGLSNSYDSANDPLLDLSLDPESFLDHHIAGLYLEKLASDNEDMLAWQLDTSMGDSAGKLEMPDYYQVKQLEDTLKPVIQPFDPRFTIAMYYEAIYRQMKNQRSGRKVNGHKLSDADATLPFHWEDWVDMGVLTKYILNPNDPLGCLPVDATKEGMKKHEEDEKKKQDEQKKKDDEEKRKQEEEKKKQDEDKRIEEEKAKSEQDRINDALAKERAKWELEHQKEVNEVQKEEVKEEPKEDNPTVANPDDKQEHPIENKDSPQNDSPILTKREINFKKPEEFCHTLNQVTIANGNLVNPSFNVHKFGGRLTSEKMILMGRSHLYSYFPTPESVVFLTQDGMYRVRTLTREKLLYNGIPEAYREETKLTTVDIQKSFKKLQNAYPANKGFVQTQYLVNLEPRDFRFDAEKEMTALKRKKSLQRNEKNYLDGLTYSESFQDDKVPKYFQEANIIGNGLGDHYDWRFFNGIGYKLYEQTLTLHHMIRTWLSFCRKVGLNTWVAHGLLLLWYWDGMAFPWDNDIDVQMPIQDLHKLSLYFNQTVVVEDAHDGFGRYFLDCGSFVSHRTYGNGMNNIDARLIDLDTGLYIDITGLAVSNQDTPDRYKKNLPAKWNTDQHTHFDTNQQLEIYNCRNKHFSLLSELSPLRQTMVEGELAYVPNKFLDMLRQEYLKGLSLKKHLGFVFLPQLRLWVPEDDIFYFLQDKAGWVDRHLFAQKYTHHESEDKFDMSYELSDEEKKNFKKLKLGIDDDDLTTIFELTPEELLMFLRQDDMFLSYYTSSEFTKFHSEEIMRLLHHKLTMQVMKLAPDFTPLKLDPFMFKQRVEGRTYAAKVKQYTELQKNKGKPKVKPEGATVTPLGTSKQPGAGANI